MCPRVGLFWIKVFLFYELHSFSNTPSSPDDLSGVYFVKWMQLCFIKGENIICQVAQFVPFFWTLYASHVMWHPGVIIIFLHLLVLYPGNQSVFSQYIQEGKQPS